MDNLEKLILQHEEEINGNLPPEGHIERFELKLSGKHKRFANYWIGFASGIAAVLVIGLFFFFNRGKQENQTMTLSKLSGQYAEVEVFYTSSINNQTTKLMELTNKLEKNDPSLEAIKKELKDFDQTYQQISTDLQTTPNDERVISAMISYYQTKLEIINRILNQLENKQSKSNSHENTDI